MRWKTFLCDLAVDQIGDLCSDVSGQCIPEPREDHAAAVASMVLDIQTVMQRWPELRLRIGVQPGTSWPARRRRGRAVAQAA